MKHRKLQLTAGLAGILLWAGASAGTADRICETDKSGAAGLSATPIVATEGPDVLSVRNQRDELHRWLMSTHGAPGMATTRVPLTRQDRIDLGLEQCADCKPLTNDSHRLRVGVNKSVGHRVDFSTLPLTERGASEFAGGEIRANADGLGWRKTVSSPEAHAVRLMLRNVHLPDDAAVFVYNKHGEAFGPYLPQTGKDELWTHTISGEDITVVVQFFNGADRASLANARLEIAEIVHLGPDFRIAESLSPSPRSGNGHCSYNESCVEDASCYGSSDFAHIDDARQAAGHMLFSSGPWAYVCSGGLMADTDGSQTPYFITANHCISSSGEANSLETYFQYSTSSCGASCPSRGGFPRTLGSSILSTNSTSDYTLLLLDQSPPSGSVFLGWTSAAVASTSGYELYRISHPSGAPQAFSSHVVDTGAPTCSGWPRGPWIYADDLVGATEGGSSGSPVLNASGQVVGMLSGACGYNVNDVCDSESNATVDGALAHFFDDVAEWLAPDGNGGPGDADGTMSVAGISLSVRSQGPWRTGQATVTIQDENGNAVGGATVSGSFSGDVGGSASGSTSGNGSVVLSSDRVRQSSISFTFCVDSVSHPDFDYEPDDNSVTCLSN